MAETLETIGENSLSANANIKHSNNMPKDKTDQDALLDCNYAAHVLHNPSTPTLKNNPGAYQGRRSVGDIVLQMESLTPKTTPNVTPEKTVTHQQSKSNCGYKKADLNPTHVVATDVNMNTANSQSDTDYSQHDDHNGPYDHDEHLNHHKTTTFNKDEYEDIDQEIGFKSPRRNTQSYKDREWDQYS